MKSPLPSLREAYGFLTRGGAYPGTASPEQAAPTRANGLSADSPFPAGSGGQAKRPRPEFHGIRVLLVEDEASVRKLAKKLLEVMGCSVVEAANGREALRMWTGIQSEVDLVISDIFMPGDVSGWDLARELHLRHPDLGILLTSGHTQQPDEQGLGDIPQIAFLQKPYGIASLRSMLADLIGAALPR